MSKTAPNRVMRAVLAETWCCTAGALERIIAIAERTHGPDLAAQRNESKSTDEGMQVADGIAYISVLGPLFPRANIFTSISGATSSELLARDIGRANDDPEVSGIALVVDSPGGAMTGIAEIYDAIEGASKPVLAYGQGEMASAAYWLASAADHVALARAAWAGSIGAVLGLHVGDDDVIEITSSNAPHKRIDPADEDNMAEVQRQVDSAAALMCKDIAKGRGTSVDLVENNYGKGGMLIASDALTAGMCDSINTLGGAVAEMNP